MMGKRRKAPKWDRYDAVYDDTIFDEITSSMKTASIASPEPVTLEVTRTGPHSTDEIFNLQVIIISLQVAFPPALTVRGKPINTYLLSTTPEYYWTGFVANSLYAPGVPFLAAKGVISLEYTFHDVFVRTSKLNRVRKELFVPARLRKLEDPSIPVAQTHACQD